MIKEIHDLKQLRTNGITYKEYIDSLNGKGGEEFKQSYINYNPNEEVITKLAEKANGYIFVVFSAVWCKDCKSNCAAFLKIVEKKPEIDAIFFKGMKSAPLDPNVRWRIPPSPPEVDEFDLRKIPTFYILNSKGKIVGEMVENPVHKETLEEELVFILENISE
ncbi:MAG: hypothetical protein EAX90_08390 [Candidatus Heimdallarchaeota archaeon]|nr:hypothetical protein [Candidatus Heimdallarchaeota archaeon]